MRSIEGMTLPASIADGARPPTQEERRAMMAVVQSLDDALGAADMTGLAPLFAVDATCELKPAGLRIEARDTIVEMFRRTQPGMAASFRDRRQDRFWANQNGIVREWSYPVPLASGEDLFARQLEVIEFAEGLGAIASYRLRMSHRLAQPFERALGEDFTALPAVRHIFR